MILFGVKYWVAYLFLIVAGTIGVVSLLYFRSRDIRELNKLQIAVLTTLRFSSFFLIALLLLSPYLKSLKKNLYKPIIITAWDNSASMTVNTDSSAITKTVSNIRERIESELGGQYSIIEYTYGEKVTSNIEPNFTEKKSDYNGLFSVIAENHFNDQVGALILSGDGIYNHGANPINRLDQVSFPVFTIGFGDTTQLADARIRSVRVNRTAFTGNQFPVEIDTYFHRMKGEQIKLKIFNGEKEVAETVITPTSNDFFIVKEFLLEASEPGLKHYSVTLESNVREQNEYNNHALFIVNVLENRQKILFLSDGYTPDIGVFRTLLEEYKEYEISIYTEEPYPSDLQNYNLIVLSQLPSATKSMASLLVEKGGKKIPILILIGNKTFLPQLNTLISGVRVDPLSTLTQEAQATVNPGYSIFSLSEESKELISQFPPLHTPLANYHVDSQFNTLLYQRIKNSETENPLLSTGIIDGRKVGILFGEGIYRWRLNNYLRNQSHDQISELVSRLIKYLALRQNEDNFMIDFESVYSEIDDVVMQAEVYNDLFERITSEEVNIELSNDEGDSFEFTFDIRDDYYYLNAGKLPIGSYNFKAAVSIGDEKFEEDGKFVVTEVNLEHLNSVANHGLLYQMASLTNGEFCLPHNIDPIIEALKSKDQIKSVHYFQEVLDELLNLKWIFFVIVTILSVEWFLRKYWGFY